MARPNVAFFRKVVPDFRVVFGMLENPCNAELLVLWEKEDLDLLTFQILFFGGYDVLCTRVIKSETDLLKK